MSLVNIQIHEITNMASMRDGSICMDADIDEKQLISMVKSFLQNSHMNDEAAGILMDRICEEFQA